MIPRVRIPETEYQDRIRKAAARARARGRDGRGGKTKQTHKTNSAKF